LSKKKRKKFWSKKVFSSSFLTPEKCRIFSPTNTILNYTRERTSLRETQRTHHEQTKESASAARGEREDGFEGRERRTFGAVFEDS